MQTHGYTNSPVVEKTFMTRINVTKSFLPPIEEYEVYLKRIWDSAWLSNQGPLLHEFEAEASDYLGVENFQFVANGTIALQVAIRALDLLGSEIITTPFSYVATTSSILWEQCSPIFVDIDPESLCIDPTKIEASITDKTKAIMAVHVFGNPCDVEAIESIAKKHNLKVIYDGAHAFGVTYKGKSLLSYGDISICSFHATKLFHTIEGGCIISKDKDVNDKVDLLKRFGHTGDEHFRLGINAKANEFQAAMGLCNLPYVPQIIEKRKKLHDLYDERLSVVFQTPKIQEDTKYNYGYYPVIFSTKDEALAAQARLAERDIFARRYFYPSLNTLPYITNGQSCPISEDISERILCLPLYYDLEPSTVNQICKELLT